MRAVQQAVEPASAVGDHHDQVASQPVRDLQDGAVGQLGAHVVGTEWHLGATRLELEAAHELPRMAFDLAGFVRDCIEVVSRRTPGRRRRHRRLDDESRDRGAQVRGQLDAGAHRLGSQFAVINGNEQVLKHRGNS